MTNSIELTFAERKDAAGRTGRCAPVRRYTAAAPDADPHLLWELFATPAWWPRWAPHITAVTTAGAATDPVAVGDRVRIHGPGPVAVTAELTLVEQPRRWDFRVALPGGVHLDGAHEVQWDDPPRVEVCMRLDGATGPVGAALRRTHGLIGAPLLLAYAPLAELSLRRLVALATWGGSR